MIEGDAVFTVFAGDPNPVIVDNVGLLDRKQGEGFEQCATPTESPLWRGVVRSGNECVGALVRGDVGWIAGIFGKQACRGGGPGGSRLVLGGNAVVSGSQVRADGQRAIDSVTAR